VPQDPLVNVIGEQFALEIDLHNARQMGFNHLVVKLGTRSTVGEFAPALLLAIVLSVKFACPKIRLFF
jgi:hypothetical protein